MPASKRSFNAALALLCLTVSVTQCCRAQEWTKDPTTWWPDPSTGLMWTGQMHASPHWDPDLMMARGFLGRNGLSWYQARDYCSSLQLAGFAGWRVPTLEEAKAVTEVRRIGDCCSKDFTDFLFLKGSISTFSKDLTDVFIWTSTPSQSDPNSAWAFAIPWNQFFTKPVTNQEPGVICVRPMEPDLLQTAKAAEVNHPVPDIQTLQTFIPLNKARLAYQAGNYQESIAQAQIAISLKADPATANWGIGISYGRLGQWDQAIANLQTALSIDKNSNEAKTALKWAKDGQKAAKHDKTAKDKPPVWK